MVAPTAPPIALGLLVGLTTIASSPTTAFGDGCGYVLPRGLRRLWRETAWVWAIRTALAAIVKSRPISAQAAWWGQCLSWR